jgi:hypothetical protein
MSFVREIPSGFHFWETQAVQDVVENGWIDKINPSSGFEAVKEGRLKFVIPGKDSFIDLGKSHIYLKLKIVGSGAIATGTQTSPTSTPIDVTTAIATSGLSVINNIAHSLFRQIEVSIGGVTITKGDGNYAYKSYIEVLCNATKEAQETYFHVVGWTKDDASTDTNQMDSNSNGALATRRNYFTSDGIGEFIMRPHTGIVTQHKHIIPYTEVIVTLDRHSNPAFFMRCKTHTPTAGTPFNIEIIQATYEVQRYKATSLFQNDFEQMLKLHPIVYNIKGTQIQTCTIPSSVSNYSIAEFFKGVVPKRIVIFFVATTNYNGSYTTNPFNLDHFKVESMRVMKNGLDYPYPETLTNFQSTPHSFMISYHRMMTSLGFDYNDHVISVTPKEYEKGYFFYSFLMTPDQEPGSNLLNNSTTTHPAQIKIEVRFSENLKESIQMMVWSESESSVLIDTVRRVVVTHK